MNGILTKDNAKRYFDTQGVNCPFCDSHRIDVKSPEVEIDRIWRDCYCNECDQGWFEEYSLSRIFTTTNKAGIDIQQANTSDGFESWWWDVGSGLAPRDGEDVEEFAKRVALEAWNRSKESR